MMRVMMLVFSLLCLGGCADLLILTAITIKCGPMPMSASDCEGGRGWGFTPSLPPPKPMEICEAWVDSLIADALGCVMP